jgi:hypothetical protein
MTHRFHREGQGTADWIMGAVKSNPEGLLLLAAGCALLLRSGASGRNAHAHERSGSMGTGRERMSENYGPRQTGAGISETISQAADSARDYAADVSKTVSDKAGTYASAVGEYADDAWRQSERFVVQARNTVQDTINRVVQEQPLAVAVVGLAAGAAVAAAFPATAVERRTLGTAGERLTDAAASAGQQLSRQAASKAGEMLMDAAYERGLNAEGLKEVASDVAGALGSAFTGEKGRSGQSAASSSSAAQSSPGGTSQQGGPRTPNTTVGEAGTDKSKKRGGSGQSNDGKRQGTS